MTTAATPTPDLYYTTATELAGEFAIAKYPRRK